MTRKTKNLNSKKRTTCQIRVLEAKRADKSQRVRELESHLTEAETFVSLCSKLKQNETRYKLTLFSRPFSNM